LEALKQSLCLFSVCGQVDRFTTAAVLIRGHEFINAPDDVGCFLSRHV
jgi:hypothetical protein